MKKHWLRRYSIFVFALVSSISMLVAQTESIAAKGEVAYGTQGMATTAHPLATRAAIDILKKGGNAVDAAVAAAFAIGVVEPDGSGIGGGGGMLIYLAKEKKSFYVNYYQQTSARINEVNYNPKTDSRSAKAILIPGTVAGLTLALERYGSLSLAVVLEPAIRYAETGFPIDQTLAQILLDNVELLQKYPSSAAIFLRDGFPLAEGDTLRQAALAQVLRGVAQLGRSGFYEGSVAEALAKGVQENGGALTVEDLRSYRAILDEPVRGTYRNYQVLSASAPQSGISIIQALNMLENENLVKLGHFAQSTEALHLMAETMRRMYADRTAFLDDPRSGHVPVQGMTSKEYARTRFDDINRAMAEPSEYRKTKAGNPMPYDDTRRASKAPVSGDEKKVDEWDDDDNDGNARPKKDEDDMFNRWGAKKKKKILADTSKATELQPAKKIEKEEEGPIVPLSRYDRDAKAKRNQFVSRETAHVPQPGEGGHTTHLSVVDKQGNVVSLTQTLGTFFGSGLTIEGVLLNCGLSNFSTTLSINTIGPNKQPRSSIAPTILLKDGRPFLSVGSPGATRIEATIIELITNIIDYGMDAGAANQAPRFFCQKNDDYLHLESRISDEVQQGLRKKGHQLRVYGDFDLFFGGAQLIMIDPTTNKYFGSADPRRGGVAIGY